MTHLCVKCRKWIRNRRRRRFEPDWAVTPGQTIAEIIVCNSAEENAHKLDITVDEFYEMIDGSLRISNEIADKLPKVCGLYPAYWRRLESNYRRILKRLEK